MPNLGDYIPKGSDFMICPNCGATLPDTAQICFSCRMQFNANYKQQQRNAQVNKAQKELQELKKTGNTIYCGIHTQ